MSSAIRCFICDEDVCESTVILVKEKGIETFRQASKRRNDGKLSVLVGKTLIKVHASCQKKYTNERMIAADLKKSATVSTCIKSLQSSSMDNFSFKTHCFVCGSLIPEDYLRSQQRLPPHERNLVHIVTKVEMKSTIMQQSVLRGDVVGEDVINRIQPITDMVAAGCKYHDKCLKNLYIRRPKVDVKKNLVLLLRKLIVLWKTFSLSWKTTMRNVSFR